jgi:hypothetical protein
VVRGVLEDMGRISNGHFAEGWQNQAKNVSEKIAEARRDVDVKEAKAATRVMDKVVGDAKAKTADAAHLNESKQRVEGQKPEQRQPAAERSRPELQDKATRSNAEVANREFLKNREDAGNLKKLQSRATVEKSDANPATNKAVVTKGTADRPDLSRQDSRLPVAELVSSAKGHVETNEAKTKAALHIARTATKAQDKKGTRETDKGPDAKRTDAPKNNVEDARLVAKAAPLDPGLGAAQNVERKADKRPEKFDDKKDAKRDESPGKSSALARSEGKEASRDLNSLLGGFSGGDGGANPDGSAPAGIEAGPDAAKGALPEEDPSFKVYSEFDSERPGVEYVKSKAQVFSRMVEKRERLAEIAKLDEKLDDKLIDVFKNSFETTPLSKRIIGELKEEFKEELNLTRFLGSVYGGICG